VQNEVVFCMTMVHWVVGNTNCIMILSLWPPFRLHLILVLGHSTFFLFQRQNSCIFFFSSHSLTHLAPLPLHPQPLPSPPHGPPLTSLKCFLHATIR
jgi:hypothetical protein